MQGGGGESAIVELARKAAAAARMTEKRAARRVAAAARMTTEKPAARMTEKPAARRVAAAARMTKKKPAARARLPPCDYGGVVELARKAAAVARTEPAARLAAAVPHWNHTGVHRRKDSRRYYSVIWDTARSHLVWLGSYDTPKEAAYAYDAAYRAMRGHRATPKFPAPAPEAAVPVSTDLALAPPSPPAAAPAHRFLHQQQPLPELHRQASFDNWLMSGAAAAAGPREQQQERAPPAFFQQQQQKPTVPQPPFTQFFHIANHAATAAGAAVNAAAVNPFPSTPGAYILTPQNVHMAHLTNTINPASTQLSSTDPFVACASLFLPAAAPTTQHRRELPASQAVVADNFAYFTGYGASSSAALPLLPVPQLTDVDLLLQLGLPRRGGGGGGPGWAQ